jgi:hypothetical protein
MAVLLSKRRRRPKGMVGENDIIDYDDGGGGGRVGGEEASE